MNEVLSEVLPKKEYEKVNVILSYIDENGKISPKESEHITRKSAATVRRYFKMLVDTGYIKVEGHTNNIAYYASGEQWHNK